MKNAMYIALGVGLVSLVLGIISRLILTPIVVDAHAFLEFTGNSELAQNRLLNDGLQ